jgi:hypothetical protein
MALGEHQPAARTSKQAPINRSQLSQQTTMKFLQYHAPALRNALFPCRRGRGESILDPSFCYTAWLRICARRLPNPTERRNQQQLQSGRHIEEMRKISPFHSGTMSFGK